MTYGVLFLGLPVLGIGLYAYLCRRMAAAGVAWPLTLAFLAIFAAYGAALLFGVSVACGVWSGMHSVAAFGLAAVGLPWLVGQGVVLEGARARSPYHRAAAALSLGFPVALAALVAFAFGVGR